MGKGKVQSLRHQGKSAVYGCFKPGMSKHSDMIATKSGGRFLELTHKIYSFKNRNALLNIVNQGMPFIKERYPHIRFVRDIPVGAWSEFLESKEATCSTATINGYATRIRKLARCISHHFNCSVDWTKGLTVPTSEITPDGRRLRDKQIELEDYLSCMAYATRPGTSSKAPIAWELSARFGPRVSGASKATVSDVYLGDEGMFGLGQLHVNEKGGRDRMIDVRTLEDREFLENLVRGKTPDTLLVGITAGAVNKALNRTMEALGMKDKYPETRVHGLRKLYAQRCWDDNRRNGMSYKDNVAYVNLQLGHSATRDTKVLRVYVTTFEVY